MAASLWRFPTTATTKKKKFRWYASVLDLRSLALFRILLGCYLLYDLYSRLGLGPLDLAWYTRDGYLAANDTPHKAPLHQVWFYRGSVTTQMFLFSGTILLAMLFTLGCYCNALVKTLLFLSVTSYQNRNMYLHDGSDTFLRLVLFWSIFLPLDQVWSISSASFVRSSRDSSATKAAAQRKQPYPPLFPPGSVTSFACGALTLQIVLMYWGTVAHRTIDYEDGWHHSEWMPPKLTAVHYALSGDFAVRNNVLTQYVRSHPTLTRTMTASAMILEVVAPLLCLLDNRNRGHWHALQMFILHLGLLLMIRLPNWQLLGMLTQVLWIPTRVWDQILRVDRVGLAKKTDARVPNTSPNNDDGDDEQDHDYGGVEPPVVVCRTSSRISYGIQVFFLLYMIYNWCGMRGWIDKHDRGDIGEALRLSQYWVMYGAVSHVASNVHLTGVLLKKKKNGGKEEEEVTTTTTTVDLLRYISTGEMVSPLPSPEGKEDSLFVEDMSDRYPSPRWERALSQWAARRDKLRGERFCRKLCTLLSVKDDDRAVSFSSIELRYVHASILPPGSSKRFDTRKKMPDTVLTVKCRALN